MAALTLLIALAGGCGDDDHDGTGPFDSPAIRGTYVGRSQGGWEVALQLESPGGMSVSGDGQIATIVLGGSRFETSVEVAGDYEFPDVNLTVVVSNTNTLWAMFEGQAVEGLAGGHDRITRLEGDLVFPGGGRDPVTLAFSDF